MHPEDTSQMDPQLVQALSHLHYGLYFLSTATLAEPKGMLVSWVSQVGGRPPLVMAAVRENRRLLADLKEHRAFALNLLPQGARELAGRLARPRERRFQEIALEQGPLSLPVLQEAVGVLCCRLLESEIKPGDHHLLVGEVAGALWRGPGPAMHQAEGGHAYLGLG